MSKIFHVERQETIRRLVKRNAALHRAELKDDELLEKMRAVEMMNNQKIICDLAAIDGTKLDVPIYEVKNIDMSIRQKNDKWRRKKRTEVKYYNLY